MITPIGSRTLLALDDLMEYNRVRGLLSTNFARMRRPALGENFSIGLPAFHYDMFRIANRYASPNVRNETGIDPNTLTNLPLLINRTGMLDTGPFAVIPVNKYTTPTFDNLKNWESGFPFSIFVGLQGKAYTNNFSIDFLPVAISGTVIDFNPYQRFNRLIHRAIVQPGIVMMPYMYNTQVATQNIPDYDRIYGPVLVKQATIRVQNGKSAVNVNFDGSTCLSGFYRPTALGAILNLAQQLRVPSRESGLVDAVILMMDEATEFFDPNTDMFLQDAFETTYQNGIEITQQDLENQRRRIESVSLTISNEYENFFTQPGNTSNLTNYERFTSSSQAGQRYFTLKNRRVQGEITFVSDRIDDIDYDFTGDNDTNNHRLIISLAPGFHFPLTHVQFKRGVMEYTPEKAIRAKYSFVARMSVLGRISLLGTEENNTVRHPTSEFGYSYDLRTNILYSGDTP